MFTFYRYIFGKLYFFGVNTIKEKEFPWAFPSGVIAFIVIINLLTVVSFYEYMILPNEIGALEGKIGNWVALAILFFAWIYVRSNHRYKKILEYYKEIPPSRKKALGILSILYVIISLVAFVYVGHLHRVYNGID